MYVAVEKVNRHRIKFLNPYSSHLYDLAVVEDEVFTSGVEFGVELP